MSTALGKSCANDQDNIIWTATAPQINRWRKKHLMLKATDMAHLSVKKVGWSVASLMEDPVFVQLQLGSSPETS